VWQVKEDDFIYSFDVCKRIIRWGNNENISTIKHPYRALRKEILFGLLHDKLIIEHDDIKINVFYDKSKLLSMNLTVFQYILQSFDWVIDATGRNSIVKQIGFAKNHAIGHRKIISTEVKMHNQSNINTMYIETLHDGWLLLTPIGENKGILQAMIANYKFEPHIVIENMLKRAVIIKSQISHSIGSVSLFDAFPQITDPLCGFKWISIGDSAISFDPLSGDGIGSALKCALLASGVINGISQGMSKEKCLNHYSTRLRKALVDHLGECLRYYLSSKFTSLAWDEEIRLMIKLLRHLKTSSDFLYGLNNYCLVPLTDEFN